MTYSIKRALLILSAILTLYQNLGRQMVRMPPLWPIGLISIMPKRSAS